MKKLGLLIYRAYSTIGLVWDCVFKLFVAAS